MILMKKGENFFRFRHEHLRSVEEKKVADLIPYLSEIIKLEKGVTFEQFFNIIIENHEKYSEVFASHLGQYELSDWLDEWNLPTTKNKKDPMSHLRIQWSDIEIFPVMNYKEYVQFFKNIMHKKINITKEEFEKVEKEKKIEASNLTDFHGIGFPNKKTTSIFSIEFTPLNELKSYELKLDINYIIRDYKKKYKESIIMKMIKEYTVYDVIGGILYEISFAGSPEHRNNTLNEIQDTIGEIKDQFNYEKNLKSFLKKNKINLSNEE